mmetsp:Transcript_56766/g.135226  ORF Transcript_56766/g.135226 Transcript_56766/m.135226 type:complete len:205 (+) Transcript_56766:951-1565(+)
MFVLAICSSPAVAFPPISANVIIIFIIPILPTPPATPLSLLPLLPFFICPLLAPAGLPPIALIGVLPFSALPARLLCDLPVADALPRQRFDGLRHHVCSLRLILFPLIIPVILILIVLLLKRLVAPLQFEGRSTKPPLLWNGGWIRFREALVHVAVASPIPILNGGGVRLSTASSLAQGSEAWRRRSCGRHRPSFPQRHRQRGP